MFFKPMTFNVDSRLQNPSGTSVPSFAPLLEAVRSITEPEDIRKTYEMNHPIVGVCASHWILSTQARVRPGPDTHTHNRRVPPEHDPRHTHESHRPPSHLEISGAVPIPRASPELNDIARLTTPASESKRWRDRGACCPRALGSLDLRPGSEEVGVSSSTVAADKVYGSGIAMNVDPFSIVTEEVEGRKVVKSAPVLGLVSLLSSEGTVDHTFLIDEDVQVLCVAVDVERLLIVRYLEFSESSAKQESSKSMRAGGAESAYFSRKDDEKGKGKSGTL
ncbi:hypothetical protein BJ742DRAFT_741663 [Cladochytrium replicatum]|nr:hypothetical protein BJ742DRAFT_741663 [Cladochytrium replicatum]